MNFIKLYASDGSLLMPDEQKPKFRNWAYEELKRAFPNYSIDICNEPNINIVDLYSDDKSLTYGKIKYFIENMFERWERVYKRGDG